MPSGAHEFLKSLTQDTDYIQKLEALAHKRVTRILDDIFQPITFQVSVGLNYDCKKCVSSCIKIKNKYCKLFVLNNVSDSNIYSTNFGYYTIRN